MSKFHRTVITVEILSEEPVNTDNLQHVYEEITNGEWSGKVETTLQEEVDGATMAKLLQEQGSDPEFFCLDENGDSLLDDTF